MRDGQIKFDTGLAQEYGAEEAIAVGILFDPVYMRYVRKKGTGFAELGFDGDDWDIVAKDVEDGRTWIALNDREFEILFPFWKVAQVQEVMNRLIEKEILDRKQGAESRGTFYALKPALVDKVVLSFK